MKRTARIATLIIILLVSTSSVWATVSSRPFLQLNVGGVLCHPTADYLNTYPGDSSVEMPTFRTSFSFGLDAQLVDIKVNSLEFGLGFSYVNVSRSLAYGVSRLKAYNGFGVLLSVGYNITDSFSLSLSGRYMGCRITKSGSRFAAVEAELTPSLTVVSNGSFNMAVCTPLTLSYKADAISLRGSIALRLMLDFGVLEEGTQR